MRERMNGSEVEDKVMTIALYYGATTPN